MGYEPENTLRSFQKALELGADAVELDVYVCKTGEIVVIHDDTVDRTTNGTGFVVDMNFDELRALDAGKGEKIPTLSEVFDLIKARIPINIELKGPHTAEAVCRIIADYTNKGVYTEDDFFVSSFDHYELLRFKEHNPRVRIGALITGIPLGFASFAEKLEPFSINLCIEFITKEFVDDAHKRGYKVFVWTLKDPRDIPRMRDYGVDGIFTNFPDTIRL